ncbi:twin-arginine translocation signal domain-containing protein [Haladaptatus halobius]|nr:twin-arginine translocation signal domain-containing protein [Haladaptatus halobius]
MTNETSRRKLLKASGSAIVGAVGLTATSGTVSARYIS